jgi:putative DNA primase/helicase
MRFNGGTLKLLTGGNTIDARALYRMPMKVRPTWQIVMECNTRPDPPADDDAVWRRLRQVGWDVVIPEPERDTTLPQKLGRDLPGILNRLLDGWRDYRDNGGIRVPETVGTATKQWRVDVDVIGHFLDECCWTGAGEHASTPSSHVYARWVRWCKRNGEDPGSHKRLTETLRRRDVPGVQWRRSNGAKWFGLLLQPDIDDDTPIDQAIRRLELNDR